MTTFVLYYLYYVYEEPQNLLFHVQLVLRFPHCDIICFHIQIILINKSGTNAFNLMSKVVPDIIIIRRNTVKTIGFRPKGRNPNKILR
jgi:hypothetical protein